MTWGFFFLLVFLGGFTLALVTGLIRRLLHPTELCDHVTAPSHEHWGSQHTPLTDLAISFVTLFGLMTFLVHGFASLTTLHEVAIGVGSGVIGVFVLRLWLGHVCDPSRQCLNGAGTARVVREIPPWGYGQVEVEVAGSQLKLAARSNEEEPIPSGAVVRILDRQESVVVVKRSS